MTKEKQDPNLETMLENEYGAFSLGTLKENKDLAIGALEELTYTQIGPKADGLLAGAVTSDKGIQTAAGVYAEKFANAVAGEEIPKLINGYYGKIVSEYFKGDTLEAVNKLVNSYEGEKYGSMMDKISKAEYILKGIKDRTYEASDEQKEAAEKTLKKYEGIRQIFRMLQTIKSQQLRPNAEKRMNQRMAESVGESLDKAA